MSTYAEAIEYLENIQKNSYIKIGVLPVEAKYLIKDLYEKIPQSSDNDFIDSFAQQINKSQVDIFNMMPDYNEKILNVSKHLQKIFPKYEPPSIVPVEKPVQLTVEELRRIYDDIISSNTGSKYEHPANSAMVRSLIPNFQKCLKYLQIEYPENIIISTLPHGEINAWVRSIPESEYKLILFQDSWLSFIIEALCIFEQYTWSSDMFSHIKWVHLDPKSSDLIGKSDKEKIEIESIAKFIDLISTYLTTRNLYSNRDPYVHSNHSIDMAFYQNRFLPLSIFILGHEFGHIYLNHYSNNPQTSSNYLDKWQKEIEADMFGLTTLIAHYREPMEGIEMIPYFLIFNYLNIIDILEKSESILLYGNEYTRNSLSHPKPDIRKELIFRTIRLLPEERQEFVYMHVGETEEKFNSLLEKITPFFYAMHLQGIRPKSVYEDDLSKIYKS